MSTAPLWLVGVKSAHEFTRPGQKFSDRSLVRKCWSVKTEMSHKNSLDLSQAGSTVLEQPHHADYQVQSSPAMPISWVCKSRVLGSMGPDGPSMLGLPHCLPWSWKSKRSVGPDSVAGSLEALRIPVVELKETEKIAFVPIQNQNKI